MARVDLSEFFENHPPKCATCAWAQGLDAPQREKFDAALRHPQISTATIWRVVRNWGYELSLESLRRHRRSCGKDERS